MQRDGCACAYLPRSTETRDFRAHSRRPDACAAGTLTQSTASRPRVGTWAGGRWAWLAALALITGVACHACLAAQPCLAYHAWLLRNHAGCFAMTELKHGSNVAGLQTEAILDVHTDEWIVNVRVHGPWAGRGPSRARNKRPSWRVCAGVRGSQDARHGSTAWQARHRRACLGSA